MRIIIKNNNLFLKIVQKRQTPPVSTGHVDASKTNPGKPGNP